MAASLNQARASALYSARFTGVTGVSAGEGTVSVTLSSPNGGLPALLDVPVCKGTGERPAGTGPYVLAGEADALGPGGQDGLVGRERPAQAVHPPAEHPGGRRSDPGLRYP